MPEGDTIHRTAIRLRQVLPGRVIAAARGDEWLIDAPALVGATIVDVEARGKHLLIRLADGRAVHGHSGMTGSWHVYAHGEPWRKPAHRAALVIETAECVVIFFSPKLLELLSADQLRRHEYLRRLGPDLLAREIDFADIVGRFRRHDHRPIGEAVMNQTICCGIGNVYKSELLFLENLDPFAPVAFTADAKLTRLLELARELMQFNLEGSARTTRFAGDRGKLWVYGRRGEHCYLCGAIIHLSRQGDAGRTTYWCPACQPPVEGTASRQPPRSDDQQRRRPPIKGCG